MEEKVEEAIRHWNQIMGKSEQGITIVAENGDFVYMNEAYRNLMGLDEHAKNFYVVSVAPGREEMARHLVNDAMHNIITPSYFTRVRRADDAVWRDVRVSIFPLLNEQETPYGCVCLLYDVSDEVATKRLKDSLLSMAAHELRTPITAIRGIVQVLLCALQLDKQLDKDNLIKRLTIIESETGRLALLANDLSDAARMQYIGSLDVLIRRYRLQSIIDSVVARHQSILPDTHTLHTSLDTYEAYVFVDVTRIEHVLDNLVSNAIKYSPSGGRVEITTTIEGQSVVVSVSDVGMGIPQSDLDKIATPFYRATNAVTRTNGLGLGLYLSKATIETHKGKFSVESTQGKGTTVSFSLPLAKDEEEAK